MPFLSPIALITTLSLSFEPRLKINVMLQREGEKTWVGLRSNRLSLHRDRNNFLASLFHSEPNHSHKTASKPMIRSSVSLASPDRSLPTISSLDAESQGSNSRSTANSYRPRFKGNGLLITAGANAFVALSSGILLSAIYPGGKNRCEYRNGGLFCEYKDRYYPGWMDFSIASLVVGSQLATAFGIAGGVVRARYDAWLVRIDQQQRIRLLPHFIWIGSTLIAVSVGTFALTYATFPSLHKGPSKVAIPLMVTAGLLSLSSGTSLIAYGASFYKQSRRIKTVSITPFGDTGTRTAGVSLSGRF